MNKGLFTIILTFLSFSLFADSYTGRELADSGEIKTISGTLNIINGESYIKSSYTLYQLHMGPEEYMEQINYAPDLETLLTVEGFFINEHIAPITVILNNKKYNFRDNNGSPMWRGSGQGKGKDSDN
ncbi:MAG: hypothetical protein OCD02_11905 [Spirochaetaceae bacterium]